jgi:hypothetical protein
MKSEFDVRICVLVAMLQASVSLFTIFYFCNKILQNEKRNYIFMWAQIFPGN